MFGSLDDQIRQFCKDTNTEYFIDDEYLYMVGISSYLLDSVFEMNANTGMVGMPQLTTEGLMVNCLLNPQLRRGRRIHVDTSSIQTQAFDIDYQSQGVDQPQKDLKRLVVLMVFTSSRQLSTTEIHVVMTGIQAQFQLVRVL